MMVPQFHSPLVLGIFHGVRFIPKYAYKRGASTDWDIEVLYCTEEEGRYGMGRYGVLDMVCSTHGENYSRA